MADFTKVNADLDALAVQLAAYIAKQVPPAPPVDEQPAVDAVDAKVAALSASIPA